GPLPPRLPSKSHPSLHLRSRAGTAIVGQDELWITCASRISASSCSFPMPHPYPHAPSLSLSPCPIPIPIPMPHPYPYPYPPAPPPSPLPLLLYTLPLPFPHERLSVYQSSLEFLALANEVVEHLPRGRSHLADQLSRASTSIVLNIA